MRPPVLWEAAAASQQGGSPPSRWKGRTRKWWLLVMKTRDRGGCWGARGRTCWQCFSFRLHWLRQPAKEIQNTSISQAEDTWALPTAPRHAPAEDRSSDRGVSRPQAPAPLLRLGKPAPSGEREAGPFSTPTGLSL